MILSALSLTKISMFDRDGTNTIKFEEFQELWKFVTEWLNCFRSFDRDNSGMVTHTMCGGRKMVK